MRITTLFLLLFLCIGCEKTIDHQIEEQNLTNELAAKSGFSEIGETPFPCLSSSFMVNGFISPSINSSSIQLELLSNQQTAPTPPESIDWIVSSDADFINSSPTLILPTANGKQYQISLSLNFGDNVIDRVNFCISANGSQLSICPNYDIVGGGLSCHGNHDVGKELVDPNKNTNTPIGNRGGDMEIFIY